MKKSAFHFPGLTIALPEWIGQFLPPPEHRYASPEEKMKLAIDLSRLNIAQQTGGPFGAAIFDMSTGRLVAPGVNIVVTSNWSGAHAEIIACALAQQIIGSHDLGSLPDAQFELVSSTEPCSMCYGAIPWTGVRRLLCGARGGDAIAIGFDEGPKPRSWIKELENRGIQVVRDVLRDDARQVLRQYRDGGGKIYNGRESLASQG